MIRSVSTDILSPPAHQCFREWREKQAEEIAAREERAKARRQETISKAEKAIDDFYEDYAAKKERTIGENKCVCSTFIPYHFI